MQTAIISQRRKVCLCYNRRWSFFVLSDFYQMMSSLQTMSSLKRVIVLFILAFSLPAWADTRYVIDELSVNMRKGMGTDFAINAILTSGDSVSVLSDDSDGYSKVRTADGKVGYVLSRFLSKQPTGHVRVERMQTRLEALEKKNSELEAALVLARSKAEKSIEQSGKLGSERDRLIRRLEWIEDASANSVKIAEENLKLREQLLAIDSEISTLRQENREIKTWQKGQKMGAIILAFGIFVGWLIGRFRKPGSAWSSDRL